MKRKKAVAAKAAEVATAVAADGSVDPTLLTSTVTIKGKEYTLCFDLLSLARAEHELRKAGHDVNLFEILPVDTAERLLTMFAVALRRFHPDIPFEDALRIPGLGSFYQLRLAVVDAWRRSLEEPEVDSSKNPTQPGE